jgi:hypothetical protein
MARRFFESLSSREVCFSDGRLYYVLVNGRWHLRVRFGKVLEWRRPERATLILLSYKRLHNMQALVDCTRKVPFFDRIIVANNNVDVRIEDWVRTSDPRVTMWNQAGGGPAGTRYDIAYRTNGEYFLSVDDDIFLSPEQYQLLFEALLAEPQVPHGICGQMYFADASQEADLCFCPASAYRGPVTVLNRVYAFTKSHMREFFRLLQELGYKDVWEAGPIDDIVVSYSGDARPLSRFVGPVADCPLSNDRRVSVWRQEGFHKRRLAVVRRLEEIKPLAARRFLKRNPRAERDLAVVSEAGAPTV